MTEESKKRMNEISKNFGTHYEKIYKEGYQAGMQDPDACKVEYEKHTKIEAGLCADISKMYELLDECKKVLLIAWGQLEAGCKEAERVDQMIEKIREARK